MNTYFIKISLLLTETIENYLINKKINFKDIQVLISDKGATKIYSAFLKSEDATLLKLTFPIEIIKVDI